MRNILVVCLDFRIPPHIAALNTTITKNATREKINVSDIEETYPMPTSQASMKCAKFVFRRRREAPNLKYQGRPAPEGEETISLIVSGLPGIIHKTF